MMDRNESKARKLAMRAARRAKEGARLAFLTIERQESSPTPSKGRGERVAMVRR